MVNAPLIAEQAICSRWSGVVGGKAASSGMASGVESEVSGHQTTESIYQKPLTTIQIDRFTNPQAECNHM
jgi:hypothetical protein